MGLGSLRRRMCSNREGTARSINQEPRARNGQHPRRYTGRHLEDDLRRTGRSRSGVVQLHGPAWHSQDVTSPAPEVPRQLQVRLLGEKMDGGPGLGQQEPRQTSKHEIQPGRQTETGPDGGSSQQAPRLPLLPAQNGTQPHRPVPSLEHATPRRLVLVVPV